MPSWLTMQNVTFSIAVAGFVMSLASWIKDFLSQRKNLSFRILEVKSYCNVTFFDLLIENRLVSQLQLPTSPYWTETFRIHVRLSQYSYLNIHVPEKERCMSEE